MPHLSGAEQNTPTGSPAPLTCIGALAVNEDDPTHVIVHILRGKKPACVAFGIEAKKIREGCAMDTLCPVKGEGLIAHNGDKPIILSVDSAVAEGR